jgi:hexosaminidase
MTPLKKTYMYEPIPSELHENMKKNIIGVETPVWTEFIDNFDDMSKMCFPRMAAVAETGWTNRDKKDYVDFKLRHTNDRGDGIKICRRIAVGSGLFPIG